MMDKQFIRDRYLRLRLGLRNAEFNSLNQNLCTAFFSSVELFDISIVHIFLPILKRNEPNTWLIIHRLRKEFPCIRISIPKVIEENKLTHFYFEAASPLEENEWGIPEPSGGTETPVEKIDLVIVPLLAFDRQGNRVGYGRGFYDRFLSQCRPDCKKVGLSFFDPVNEISGIDKNDVRLSHCVTPMKFYSF
jgi:5-formyltetrahydrofolate cyclo-ligase